MHRELLTYPGSSRDDVVQVFASALEYSEALKILGTPENLITLDQLERLNDLSPIGVRLRLNMPADFLAAMTAVARVSSIRYIDLPAEVAPYLSSDTLPGNLEVLSLAGDGIARLPKGFAAPTVVRLSVGRIRAGRSQFPALRHVDLKIESSSTAFLSAYNLISLNARGFQDDSFLDSLAPDSLRQLGLRGGREVDLRRLSRFPALCGLWIQDVQTPVNFEPLTQLLGLRELSVGYINRQLDADAIRGLRLDHLHIFGCKDATLQSMQEAAVV